MGIGKIRVFRVFLGGVFRDVPMFLEILHGKIIHPHLYGLCQREKQRRKYQGHFRLFTTRENIPGLAEHQAATVKGEVSWGFDHFC